MASAIDVTKPITGNPTTQSVRDNFTTTKSEIEALQTDKADLASPTFTGTATADNLTATGTVTFTGATVADLGTVTTADINGGTIDGTSVGAITPAVGAFINLTVTDDAAFDTDTLYVDSSADSVGVGTTDPITSLEVVQDASLAATIACTGKDSLVGKNYIGYYDDADALEGFVGFNAVGDEFKVQNQVGDVKINANDAAGEVTLFTNNTQRMVVDASGDVGVGIAAPAYDLHVQGEVAINSVDDTTGYGKLLFRNTDNSSGFAQIQARIGDSTLRYQVATGGLQEWSQASTVRMSIDTNGLVNGVWSDNGVSNPDAKIRVLTQAQYDGLTPDTDTLYFIVG